MEKHLDAAASENRSLRKRVAELERQLARSRVKIRAGQKGAEKPALSRKPTSGFEKAGLDAGIENVNAILDALSDPILVYDTEGIIRRANRAAVEMHGFDPTDIHRGESNLSLEFRYLDGRVPSVEELPSARALKGETVTGAIVNITNARGETVSVQIASSPILIEGAPRGAISVWHNVSTLIQVEQKLETILVEAEEGRRLLEAILENIPIGLTITGGPPDYPILRVSRTGVKMSQRPPQSLVGMPTGSHQTTWDIYLADGVTRPAAEQMPLYRASRLGETVLNEDFLMIAGDGRKVPVLVNAAPVRDGQGNIIGAINAWMDISGLKAVEEALRESQQRYDALFNSGTNAIAHCRVLTDQAGKPVDYEMLKVNDAYLAVTGLPREDVVGHCIKEIYPGIENFSYNYIANLGRVALRDGELNDEAFFEPLGIWLDIYAYSPRAGEFTAIFTNITERKQAEKALRISEERFRLAVINASTIYAQSDCDLRYVWVHNFPTEFRAEDVLGKTDVELDDTEDTRRFMALKREVMETGRGLRCEHTFHRPSGALTYDITIEPMYDSAGQVTGVATAALDITELKRTRDELAAYAERLQRSNQELEQFAFVASHDLQEPLRKINRFGESVRDRLQPGMDREKVEETASFLQRMQSAAQRLQGMIDGLLELSRISTQARPFEQVDLARLAGEVISDLEPRIQQVGGRVDLGSLPAVEADPMQMRQLIQNLVTNALKFHKPNVPPVIKISGEVLSGRRSGVAWACLEFEDNGIGFDERDVAWIFQPFRRLHNAEEYKGMGLGLAICQKIVERHGGKITVRSRPGHGSTFVVRLPVQQDR